MIRFTLPGQAFYHFAHYARALIQMVSVVEAYDFLWNVDVGKCLCIHKISIELSSFMKRAHFSQYRQKALKAPQIMFQNMSNLRMNHDVH